MSELAARPRRVSFSLGDSANKICSKFSNICFILLEPLLEFNDFIIDGFAPFHLIA